MSSMRKAIGGSIHRIREFELEKVNLIDEFDILQIVGEGWFGKILLTEHRSTQTEMVLKALPKPYTSISDFYREFHYGLHLSAHRNIITTYDVAFETAGFFVFSQEYAPLGDLTSNVTETGLGELHSKRVARQLAAAVQHIHSRELVHRDIKLDNILVFKSDFSRIKLCDFGETRKVNSVVRRHNEWLPYSPPEVLQIDTDEAYKALTAHDVWQFGIVIFVCLTGCLPWQKAAKDDPRYVRYQNWHLATLNIAKKPKLFQLISSKAQRMFKRLLDPRHEKRPVSVFEVNKYLDDRWLAKLGAEKALNGGADERDELCPSMYSFHSSLEEKNQLLFTLTQYGIETTVDRSRKKDRIREWIQSSAIAEENEDESDDVSEILEKDYEEDDYSEKGELNMQGKHFPERRESTKASSDKQKRSKQSEVAPKHLERKNPFAPKVAEERRVIAQSANFPNGDRNLGIKLLSSDKFALPHVTDLQNAGSKDFPSPGNLERYNERQNYVSAPLNNLQSLEKNSRQSPSRSARVVKSTSAKPVDNTVDPGPKTVKVMNLKNAVNSNDRNSKGLKAGIRGAEVATVILSPATDGNRTNSVQNRGGTTSMSSLKEPPSNFAGGGAAILGNGGGGHLREPLQMESAYKPTSPPVPMRKHRSQTATLPVLSSTEIAPRHQQPRRSRTTVLPVGPTQTGSIQPISPLTMSVASQLVMQSFNSLQAMNVALPVVRNDESRHAKTVPAEVKDQQRSMIEKEPDRKYGKDAYEHYGIATRVSVEMARPRGSMSSDSRSASN